MMLQNLGIVFIRAVFSAAVIFLLTKLMGTKQISQHTFFDYIVGITIGSIAAQLAFDTEIPFYQMTLAMIVYSLIAASISFITNKSITLRRFFTGTPVFLVEKGKIIEKNLSKAKYDVNDLLSDLRTMGYFNISDVEYVIMETSGYLSVLPKADKKPVTPYDLHIIAQPTGLTANLIIDGHIMPNNLKGTGRSEEWLKMKLESLNIKEEDILLAILDAENNFYVYFRNEQPKKYSIFE